MLFVYPLIVLLLVAPAPISQAQEPDPVQVVHPTGMRVQRIEEPVFRGKTSIYEAGRKHPVTVVLVHGMGDHGVTDWQTVMDELKAQYHVLAFDLPGFNSADKGNYLYSMDKYAAVLDYVITRHAHEKVILMGHSMGGAIALRYTRQHARRIQQLVLVDVAGVLHRVLIQRHAMAVRPDWPWNKVLAPFVKAANAVTRGIMRALEFDGTPAEIQRILQSPELRMRYLDGDPVRIAATSLVTTDFSDTLRHHPWPPTLIIWGDKDPVAPLRTAYVLHHLVSGSQLQIIPFAGHVPMTERSSDFMALLRRFLTQAAPALPDRAVTGRIGRCNGQRGTEFSGHYTRIELRSCKNVMLNNVDAGEVSAMGSVLTIRNSRIGDGRGTALLLKSSRAALENVTINGRDVGLRIIAGHTTISGATLSGKTAVYNHGGHLDFAGVNLTGKEKALDSRNKTVVLFSVSRVRSPQTRQDFHGEIRVDRNNPL